MQQTKTNFKQELFEWADAIAVSLAIVLFLFTFVVQSVEVKGRSMMNTLIEGDRLIISKLFYTPDYGDIVVCRREDDSPIIKRVIATEGQQVDIDFETGEVSVDGEALNEPYLGSPTYLSYDVEFPVTVPDDSVFVMGDNRLESLDSRSSDIGMIKEDDILGRVLLRIYPLGKFGGVE